MFAGFLFVYSPHPLTCAKNSTFLICFANFLFFANCLGLGPKHRAPRTEAWVRCPKYGSPQTGPPQFGPLFAQTLPIDKKVQIEADLEVELDLATPKSKSWRNKEKTRARASAYVCTRVRACVRVCACVCVCMCACACVRVQELLGAGGLGPGRPGGQSVTAARQCPRNAAAVAVPQW